MPNILVVDDDTDFVETTRAVLESNGYQARSASGGKEALAMMREEKPDLVLLDMMMDHAFDGWCVSEAMFNDQDLIKIPIIIITGIAQTPHGGQFPTDQYLHTRDWIDKPVRYDALLEKIKLHLQGLPQPHSEVSRS